MAFVSLPQRGRGTALAVDEESTFRMTLFLQMALYILTHTLKIKIHIGIFISQYLYSQIL